MNGTICDEDVMAWLAANDMEGPSFVGCALACDEPPPLVAVRSADGFNLFERTGNPRGRPKLPPKTPRERKRRTPEEIRAARLARNARYRSKPETREKFYAWRNEHRRKRRAAGVAYADVDRAALAVVAALPPL